MKFMSVKQVVTAHGRTPEEFDRAFNETVRGLAERGVSYEVQMNTTAGLVAHIFYEERTRVAETVRDEFALRGERYECRQCPYFTEPEDGRVRKVRCKYAEPYTTAEAECCEVFYRRLLNGEIEVKEG